MRTNARIPSDVAVRRDVLPREMGDHRFMVMLSRPPLEATPAAFAELLVTPGAAAVYRAFDADVPWLDRDVEHVVAFLNVHRGVVMLAFAQGDDAAKCARSLKERRQ